VERPQPGVVRGPARTNDVEAAWFARDALGPGG
jgi:hypothetical protein